MEGQEARTAGQFTNEEWLEGLRGPGRDEAIANLRRILMRGLRYGLADRPEVDEAAREDFVQEAVLKILASLDSFRGESRFTTWAQKTAVRVALTELRRLRWRDVSLDDVTRFPDADFIPRSLADASAGPEQKTVQNALLEILRRLVSDELTDKQRQAVTAVYFHGMPIEEVARRMGTNRNGLYKLLHDARQRIKKAMIAQGLSEKSILDAFDS